MSLCARVIPLPRAGGADAADLSARGVGGQFVRSVFSGGGGLGGAGKPGGCVDRCRLSGAEHLAAWAFQGRSRPNSTAAWPLVSAPLATNPCLACQSVIALTLRGPITPSGWPTLNPAEFSAA